MVGDIYFVNDNVSVMKKESLMLATFLSNIFHSIFPHSLAFLKESQNRFFFGGNISCELRHINEPMKCLPQIIMSLKSMYR